MVAERPRRNVRMRPRRRQTIRNIILGSLLSVSVLALFPQVRAAASAVWPASSPADVFHANSIRILLMGVDHEYGADGKRMKSVGRSDSMMLADLDFGAGKITLTSIPRDTRTLIPEHGRRKINSAYSLGGAELARRAVEHLVQGQVDHTVAIDLDAFEEAVDALGGVDVVVDRDLKYTDHWANLEIDIPAGRNHLDGEHAMQFVRFRHDALADIGRVRRQQAFMQAVSEALKRPSSITALPGVARTVATHSDTDLSLAQVISLGRFARGLAHGSVSTQTLPGRFQGSGWKPDMEACRRITEAYQKSARSGTMTP